MIINNEDFDDGKDMHSTNGEESNIIIRKKRGILNK
jgi:hypothetical protein